MKADPTQLMSKLAKRSNVSHRTTGRTVNEDLDMKSYMRRRCNLLTACLTAIRVERCPKDLNACDYWLFSVIKGKSNVNLHPNVNSLEGSHLKSILKSCC